MTAQTAAQRGKRFRAAHPGVKGGGNGARAVARADKPFYGFDGEGMNDGTGHHILYTLRAGEEELYDGGRSLPSRTILRWIAQLPHRNYVGFALGYDFTMILRDIGGMVDGQGRDVLGRIIHKTDLTMIEAKFGVAIPGWGVRVSWMHNKYLIVSTITDSRTYGNERNILKVLTPLVDTRGRSVLVRLRDRTDLTVKENASGVWVPSLMMYAKWTPGEKLELRSKCQTVRISDTFGLFQCGFVKACRDWGIGTPEQLDEMQAMKDKRGAFTNTDEERAYNATECVFMAQLLAKVRTACREAGINPTNWEGAGKLAEALYRSHHTPKVRRIGGLYPQDGDIVIPDHITEISDAAYYGGRFEVTATGKITHPVFDYDINSAYPHAMRTLPCLREGHGSWVQGSRPTKHSLCRVSWHPRNGASPQLGPFPIRTKTGNLIFPLENYPGHPEWYWWSEVSAAIDSNLYDVVIEDTWTWVSTCPCPPPFGWVEDAYAQRLALIEQGYKDRAVVIKLAINSLYGKTAQTKGRAPYLNKVYAGLITAECRSMIFRAACAVGHENVLMIATDGIFTTTPFQHTTTGRKVLGEWDTTTMPDGITIVQPGLYRVNATDMYKTRGVSRNTMAANWAHFEAAFEMAWDEPDAHPFYPVEVHFTSIFRGLRLAHHRNNLAIAGEWEEDYTQTYILYPHKKRDCARFVRHPGGWWTYPPLDISPEPSDPKALAKTSNEAINMGETVTTDEELGEDW